MTFLINNNTYIRIHRYEKILYDDASIISHLDLYYKFIFCYTKY